MDNGELAGLVSEHRPDARVHRARRATSASPAGAQARDRGRAGRVGGARQRRRQRRIPTRSRCCWRAGRSDPRHRRGRGADPLPDAPRARSTQPASSSTRSASRASASRARRSPRRPSRARSSAPAAAWRSTAPRCSRSSAASTAASSPTRRTWTSPGAHARRAGARSTSRRRVADHRGSASTGEGSRAQVLAGGAQPRVAARPQHDRRASSRGRCRGSFSTTSPTWSTWRSPTARWRRSPAASQGCAAGARCARERWLRTPRGGAGAGALGVARRAAPAPRLRAMPG